MSNIELSIVEPVIRNLFPSISYLKQFEGDEHIVIEVDGVWMFRFAKTEEVARHMDVEVKLLQCLRQKINVPIPVIAFNVARPRGMGYQKIEGKLLSSELYQQCDRKRQLLLAEELAYFLFQIHSSLFVEESLCLGIGKADWPLSPQDLEGKIKGDIIKDNTTIEFFIQFLEKYEQNYLQSSDIAIVHNDLHQDNILVNSDTGQIGGIIDFTSVALGDPYLEFRYLFSIHPGLAQDVIKNYAALTKRPPDIEKAVLYCFATEFSRMAEAIDCQDGQSVEAIKGRLKTIYHYFPVF